MSQYHIARDGQQLGVFSDQDVQTGLTTGKFLPSDLLWTEGQADWQPVSSVFATAFQLQAPLASGFNPYATPLSNVSTSAYTPQLNLASRGVRFGAKLLDSLIISAVILLPTIPGIITLSNASQSGNIEKDFPIAALYWFGGAVLALIGLLIWNGIWLANHGQTIAKRMLGIRVVQFPSGQPAGAAKAFWLRAVVNYLISSFVPFYGLVDICFIFREDKRCIHDLIAETTVVVVEESR